MPEKLSIPVRYAMIGCIGLVLGWVIARALFDDVASPWWSAALAGALGGYIGGWLRERKNRS